jgi:hypothetical protein
MTNLVSHVPRIEQHSLLVQLFAAVWPGLAISCKIKHAEGIYLLAFVCRRMGANVSGSINAITIVQKAEKSSMIQNTHRQPR